MSRNVGLIKETSINADISTKSQLCISLVQLTLVLGDERVAAMINQL